VYHLLDTYINLLFLKSSFIRHHGLPEHNMPTLRNWI